MWAGSEKRPAVGMADVQLTLDNGDGLLPVEYGVVELGRRLYRSGENDYLLNRQRVRLKDLVDLLDAGHLAENAFLFIGQGMVDQALALRPEERRPLFEEVAGVRRHERRRRRAEEQLVESEANLARVDDILAELRPQAKRLAQQAEQQANRHSAADDLAAAILASAHARWHAAGTRAAASVGAVAAARGVVDAAMAELLERERAIAAAGATLDGQVVAEAAARAGLDRARADRAALQLREGRHASELEAARRERASLEDARVAAAADVAGARQVLALPMAESATELEAELAAFDAEHRGRGLECRLGRRRCRPRMPRPFAGSRRRARRSSRPRGVAPPRQSALPAEERARATSAAQPRAAEAAAPRHAARRATPARRPTRSRHGRAREAAQVAMAAAESAARTRADLLAGARAAAAATVARHDDARRALEAADGGAFSRAARARGGRSIGDGLIIEPSFQRAVDAALAGLGRAHVLPRSEIAAIAADRGVAIATESIAAQPVRRGLRRFGGRGAPHPGLARVRAAGGPLAEAVRRDDSGAARRLLARVVWLPDAAACLDLQASLPAGWQAVARDGSLVVGDVATWLRPDGRGLHLQADVDRLGAAELGARRRGGQRGERAHAAADAALDRRSRGARERTGPRGGRRCRPTARRRSGAGGDGPGRRRRARGGVAGGAGSAIADRGTPAPRGRRRPSPDDAPTPRGAPSQPDRQAPPRLRAGTGASGGTPSRREALAAAGRDGSCRPSSSRSGGARGAEAAVALAERQLAYAAKTAGDLAEREARLATEREDLVALARRRGTRGRRGRGGPRRDRRDARPAERERLRAAETAVVEPARARPRRTGGQPDRRARRARGQARPRVAARGTARRAVGPRRGRPAAARPAIDTVEPDATAQPDDDLEPEVARAGPRRSPPLRGSARSQPPSRRRPARLATLRRRFHDLGAVNPFAADEYAEVRTRLDGLEGQRSDIQSAIEHTRALISELDTLVSEQFRRTFAALERAFDERFQQLFGGGFARLSLTDPQDLASTGIEITARPPGKKPQALAMLSGGERSLTAVALLFAMLEVRPVPFCVLDEVDAALDEANIGRFTDALRDLSRDHAVHRHHPQPGHDRGRRRDVRRHGRRRLGEPRDQPPAGRGDGARGSSRSANGRKRSPSGSTPGPSDGGRHAPRRARGRPSAQPGRVHVPPARPPRRRRLRGDLGGGRGEPDRRRRRRRARDDRGRSRPGEQPADGATAAVRRELAALLLPRDPHWQLAPARIGDGAPAVVLIVGVNGTGKTTTIGKLAAREAAAGRRIVLAAADTFRAAAVGAARGSGPTRAGADIVAHAAGADPAAVVFDALDAAVARHADVVLIDTAGRLHTKSNLMDELAKIRRVINRRLPGAEPETLLVLDATTGQNGLAQAVAFHESVTLTGIVLTKLDSTSRGGIVFAIEQTPRRARPLRRSRGAPRGPGRVRPAGVRRRPVRGRVVSTRLARQRRAPRPRRRPGGRARRLPGRQRAIRRADRADHARADTGHDGLRARDRRSGTRASSSPSIASRRPSTNAAAWSTCWSGWRTRARTRPS